MARTDRDRGVSELERALVADTNEHGAALEAYFARARSIILLTANSPAFANVLAEVVANATPIPKADGVQRAIAHFEVTIESFRRAMGATKNSELRVVDGRSGRVIIDGARSQRVGARLSAPGDRRFAGLPVPPQRA